MRSVGLTLVGLVLAARGCAIYPDQIVDVSDMIFYTIPGGDYRYVHITGCDGGCTNIQFSIKSESSTGNDADAPTFSTVGLDEDGLLLYAAGSTPATTYADFTKSNVQCADSGEETLLTFNAASALYIVMECPSGTPQCQVAIGLAWTGEADPLACLVPQELRAGTELNANSATVLGGEYLQIPAIKPCGAGGSCTAVSFSFTTWAKSRFDFWMLDYDNHKKLAAGDSFSPIRTPGFDPKLNQFCASGKDLSSPSAAGQKVFPALLCKAPGPCTATYEVVYTSNPDADDGGADDVVIPGNDDMVLSACEEHIADANVTLEDYTITHQTLMTLELDECGTTGCSDLFLAAQAADTGSTLKVYGVDHDNLLAMHAGANFVATQASQTSACEYVEGFATPASAGNKFYMVVQCDVGATGGGCPVQAGFTRVKGSGANNDDDEPASCQQPADHFDPADIKRQTIDHGSYHTVQLDGCGNTFGACTNVKWSVKSVDGSDTVAVLGLNQRAWQDVKDGFWAEFEATIRVPFTTCHGDTSGDLAVAQAEDSFWFLFVCLNDNGASCNIDYAVTYTPFVQASPSPQADDDNLYDDAGGWDECINASDIAPPRQDSLIKTAWDVSTIQISGCPSSGCSQVKYSVRSINGSKLWVLGLTSAEAAELGRTGSQTGLNPFVSAHGQECVSDATGSLSTPAGATSIVFAVNCHKPADGSLCKYEYALSATIPSTSPTPSITPSATATASVTPPSTPSASFVPPSATPTANATSSPSASISVSASPTPSPSTTASITSTVSASPSVSSSVSASPSVSTTPTLDPSPSASTSHSPSASPTAFVCSAPTSVLPGTSTRRMLIDKGETQVVAFGSGEAVRCTGSKQCTGVRYAAQGVPAGSDASRPDFTVGLLRQQDFSRVSSGEVSLDSVAVFAPFWQSHRPCSWLAAAAVTPLLPDEPMEPLLLVMRCDNPQFAVACTVDVAVAGVAAFNPKATPTPTPSPAPAGQSACGLSPQGIAALSNSAHSDASGAAEHESTSPAVVNVATGAFVVVDLPGCSGAAGCTGVAFAARLVNGAADGSGTAATGRRFSVSGMTGGQLTAFTAAAQGPGWDGRVPSSAATWSVQAVERCFPPAAVSVPATTHGGASRRLAGWPVAIWPGSSFDAGRSGRIAQGDQHLRSAALVRTDMSAGEAAASRRAMAGLSGAMPSGADSTPGGQSFHIIVGCEPAAGAASAPDACSVEFALAYVRPRDVISPSGREEDPQTADDDLILDAGGGGGGASAYGQLAAGAECRTDGECSSFACRAGACCSADVALDACAGCGAGDGACTHPSGGALGSCPVECDDAVVRMACGGRADGSFFCSRAFGANGQPAGVAGHCTCGGAVVSWSTATSDPRTGAPMLGPCANTSLVVCADVVGVAQKRSAEAEAAAAKAGGGGGGGGGGGDSGGDGSDVGLIIGLMFGFVVAIVIPALAVWYVRTRRPEWAVERGLVPAFTDDELRARMQRERARSMSRRTRWEVHDGSEAAPPVAGNTKMSVADSDHGGDSDSDSSRDSMDRAVRASSAGVQQGATVNPLAALNPASTSAAVLTSRAQRIRAASRHKL